MAIQMRQWLIVAAVAALVGCLEEQGNGDSAVNEPATENDSDTSPNDSVLGRAADGYLVGANVCLDINQNWMCDSDEPSAVTAAGGEYQLDADTTQFASASVLVYADADTIDEDTGQPLGNPLRMAAPAGKAAFVSPLTTLMTAKMTFDPSLSAAEAEAAVLMDMGLNKTDADLFTDYIADPSETSAVLHATARVLGQAAQELEASLTALNDSGETALTEEQISWLVYNELADSAGAAAASALTVLAEAGGDASALTAEQLDSAIAQSSILTEPDSGTVQEQIARIDDRLKSTATDALQWLQNQGFNGLSIGLGSSDELEASVWEGTRNAETGAMTWTDSVYNPDTDTFTAVETQQWDHASYKLDSAGVWQRFNAVVRPENTYAQDAGNGAVDWLRYGVTDDGEEFPISHQRATVEQLDISGRPMREFLLTQNQLSDNAAGIIPNSALFPENSRYAVISGVHHQPYWNLMVWDDCVGEERTALELASAPEPLNCNSVWMHSASQDGRYYHERLADVFKLDAFDPDADSAKTDDYAWDNDAKLIYSGEWRNQTVPHIDYDQGGLIYDRYPRLLVELLGDPETDTQGIVNYYKRTSGYEFEIAFNDNCRDDDGDDYSVLLGNCEGVANRVYTGDQGASEQFVRRFSDLMQSPSQALVSGDSRPRPYFSDDVVMVDVRNYLGLDTVIVTEPDGQQWDYNSNLTIQFLGTPDDRSGDVALYYTTLDHVPVIGEWECNPEDAWSVYWSETLNGNCNAAFRTEQPAGETDYTDAVPVTDLFSQAVYATNPVQDGEWHEQMDGIYFARVGRYQVNSANAEQCQFDPEEVFMVMLGQSGDVAGSAQLIRSYAGYTGEVCERRVRLEETIPWTYDATLDVYEFDFSGVSETITDGEIETYLNKMAVKLDGTIPRNAHYWLNSEIYHRLEDLAAWEFETVDGTEYLKVNYPVALTDLLDDINRPDYFVDDGNWLRRVDAGNVGRLVKLPVSKQWTKTTVGSTDIISWPHTGLAGEHSWYRSISEHNGVVRRVASSQFWYEEYGYYQFEGQMLNPVALDAVKTQVRDNYETWSLGPVQ